MALNYITMALIIQSDPSRQLAKYGNLSEPRSLLPPGNTKMPYIHSIFTKNIEIEHESASTNTSN